MAHSTRFVAALAAVLGALAASFSPADAAAQATRSYAVLSLAGDKLNVIEHVLVTGSQIDRNNRQQITVADDTFDTAVLRTVRDSLKGSGEVALFASRDPRLFSLQNQALDSGELPQELTSAVRELIAKSNATHLVLVTKRSSNVSMRLHDGTVGDGKLAGLGFYLDRDLRIHDLETGATSNGFIAPFASLEVTLIDTRTHRTLRHVNATQSTVYPTYYSKTAGAPWDILTPEEKVNDLVHVIEAALHDAVPKVIAGD